MSEIEKCECCKKEPSSFPLGISCRTKDCPEAKVDRPMRLDVWNARQIALRALIREREKAAWEAAREWQDVRCKVHSPLGDYVRTESDIRYGAFDDWKAEDRKESDEKAEAAIRSTTTGELE